MDERSVWDPKAEEWAARIGDEGDDNRRYQSDPVLWRLAGDVKGLRVLDAGCGSGYLTLKLAARNAKAVGVDISPRMIEVARRRAASRGARVEYRVDDASKLATVPAGSIDLVVSNYVLMDANDLDGCAAAFARVLAPRGRAVCVFSHPCFETCLPGPYFEEQQYEDRWGGFSGPFVVYHRPLSRYFAAFLAAGFAIEAFEEPVVPTPTPPELDPGRAAKFRQLPYSVALLLRKAGP